MLPLRTVARALGLLECVGAVCDDDYVAAVAVVSGGEDWLRLFFNQ